MQIVKPSASMLPHPDIMVLEVRICCLIRLFFFFSCKFFFHLFSAKTGLFPEATRAFSLPLVGQLFNLYPCNQRNTRTPIRNA
jgi:hypothetical protein